MTSIHTLREEVERLENRAIWENAPALGIQAALLSESLARDFADGSSRNLARGIELRLRFAPSAPETAAAFAAAAAIEAGDQSPGPRKIARRFPGFTVISTSRSSWPFSLQLGLI